MKIVFDLDGTLYDTLPSMLKANNDIRVDFGYLPNSREEYRSAFQSRDWRKFYQDLGIHEKDVDAILKEFIEKFRDKDLPLLVPGAREALQMSEEVVGYGNTHIVTNEPREGVIKRFERDDLTSYLDRVDHPFQGKSLELYNLAVKAGENSVCYVGDLVSDGQDCLEARNMGARNLNFCGITHSYAINTSDAIRRFVQDNQEFSRELKNLGELSKIWIQK